MLQLQSRFSEFFHYEGSRRQKVRIMSQLRDLYTCVFREPGDTVLVQGLLNGGDQYLAYLRSPYTQDDQLGIDDMNEDGNGLAYLKPHLRQ